MMKKSRFNKIRFDVFHYDELKYTECEIELYRDNQLIKKIDNDSNNIKSIFSTWIVIENIDNLNDPQSIDLILVDIHNILKSFKWNMDSKIDWEIVIHEINNFSLEDSPNSHQKHIYSTLNYNNISANDLPIK